jgi:hypothetical protein
MIKLTRNNEKTLTKCLFLIKNKAYPIMEISIIDAFSIDQISNLDDGLAAQVMQLHSERTKVRIMMCSLQRVDLSKTKLLIQ